MDKDCKVNIQPNCEHRNFNRKKSKVHSLTLPKNILGFVIIKHPIILLSDLKYSHNNHVTQCSHVSEEGMSFRMMLCSFASYRLPFLRGLRRFRKCLILFNICTRQFLNSKHNDSDNDNNGHYNDNGATIRRETCFLRLDI